MNYLRSISSFIIFAFLSSTSLSAMQYPTTKPAVIGYVGGYKGLVNTDKISAKKLTHINYAFVNVKNNRAFLDNEKTDTVNFRKLNLLKKQNPELKILISIGGWSWSENFSDAVLTEDSRKLFAKSAVDIIRKHNLDGVDIDWEYPGMQGEKGNVFRPEDKHNFTLMFFELRKELNILQNETGKKKLLTTAVGAFAEFWNKTEMSKAQEYLDYINLMTYDVYSGEKASHHTNLYSSKADPTPNSADEVIDIYLKGGIPAEKLVMGIAFYGRNFKLENNAVKGLGDKIISQSFGKGYTYTKDSLVNKKGFKEFKDDEAKASYLFNRDTKEFITYDDEWSVKSKCEYVISKKMGGVMFWEYDSDPKEYLLNVINRTFNR